MKTEECGRKCLKAHRMEDGTDTYIRRVNQLKMNKCAHIRFSTITLFSVFHKAITALLAPHKVLHVGHVEEAHASSLLEVAVKITFAAATEDAWERMPGKGNFHF